MRGLTQHWPAGLRQHEATASSFDSKANPLSNKVCFIPEYFLSFIFWARGKSATRLPIMHQISFCDLLQNCFWCCLAEELLKHHLTLVQDLLPPLVWNPHFVSLLFTDQDTAVQFITIITAGTFVNCRRLHFFFLCWRDAFQMASYSKVSGCYGESMDCKQCVLQGGKKIIHFTQTKHPAIFQKQRKKNWIVPLSQLQYWGKKAIGLWFFFFVSSVQPSPRWKWINLLPNVCRCLHSHLLAHLSIHLFSRVQRAAFSSEEWLKEQKKRQRGRVFGAEQGLIPLT